MNFIDLHCHWVSGIDDGAPTPEHGIQMLQALAELGFGTVIATPHMRPGLFDNDRAALEHAYERMGALLAASPALPQVALSCEHYFNDVVFERLMAGQGLPYPGERAVLIEFPSDQIPARINDRLFDLRRRRLRPVLAHPERNSRLSSHPEVVEDLVERGTVLVLDVGALAGKYGRTARRSAERMLSSGAYYAACTDMHQLEDKKALAEGLEALRALVGDEEADFLLIDGPRAVLEGKVDL